MVLDREERVFGGSFSDNTFFDESILGQTVGNYVLQLESDHEFKIIAPLGRLSFKLLRSQIFLHLDSVL